MPAKAQNDIDRLIDLAEGKTTMTAFESERRSRKRVPYDATIALVLVEPDSRVGRPMALKGRDLSVGGISVISRSMMYPGSRGAMQLVRTNGQMAIVGVQVRHCRYVSDMQHHVGFKFIPLAEEMDARAFLDRRGRMIVLDAAVKGP